MVFWNWVGNEVLGFGIVIPFSSLERGEKERKESLTLSCLKKHNMRSSLKTRLQETRFWKTFGIFLRATFRPSRGSVTDLGVKHTRDTASPPRQVFRKEDKISGSKDSPSAHSGLLQVLEKAALTTQHQRLRSRSAGRAPSQPGRAPRWPGCCAAEARLLLRRCSLR